MLKFECKVEQDTHFLCLCLPATGVDGELDRLAAMQTVVRWLYFTPDTHNYPQREITVFQQPYT